MKSINPKKLRRGHWVKNRRSGTVAEVMSVSGDLLGSAQAFVRWRYRDPNRKTLRFRYRWWVVRNLDSSWPLDKDPAK